MDIRDYIKVGFEAHYNRYNQGEFSRWMHPDVPVQMRIEEDSEEEWSQWKLVPSTVSNQDIINLEQEFGLRFPEWYKAFISTYHHYFDNIPQQSITEPLDDIKNMFNPILCRLHYLPFCWDSEYGKIYCIDLNQLPDEMSCAIYQIEHEILFDLDETTAGPAELQASLELLYPNFKSYFDQTFLANDES